MRGIKSLEYTMLALQLLHVADLVTYCESCQLLHVANLGPAAAHRARDAPRTCLHKAVVDKRFDDHQHTGHGQDRHDERLYRHEAQLC